MTAPHRHPQGFMAPIASATAALAFVLAATPAARAGQTPPGIAGLGASPRTEDAFERHSGIVSLPSWVGLVSGADQARAGILTEDVGANGRLALSFGHSTGLAAPSAGALAPDINPVDRRMANMSSATRLASHASLEMKAGMAESRQTALDAPSNDGARFGQRHMRSAGAGATLGMFERRLMLEGEIAGAQMRDSLTNANADGRYGLARRLRANLSPVRLGVLALGASVWRDEAGSGYAAPGGIVADQRENGVGASLSAGSLTFSLNAVRRRNNLDRDPAVLTRSEEALNPSLGVSLERWRARPNGRLGAGLLAPSALRIAFSASRTVGRPESGGTLTAADASDLYRRSGSVALDWKGQRSTTTLTLAAGTTDSRRPGKETADGADRSLALTHAITGSDTAFAIALALRQSEQQETGNRSEDDGINLVAALTHRGGPLGTVVASFAFDHARHDAPDAAGAEVDTTWRAKAAFDLGAFPEETGGRLSVALALKGDDPDGEESPHSVEMVVGLAGRLRF